MSTKANIGQIAQLLNVTPSALRYWDKQGLLHFDRSENKYRTYSFHTIMEICNIIHYQNLSLPLKEIQSIYQNTLTDYKELFERNERALLQKISDLEDALKMIHSKQEMVTKIDLLKNQFYEVREQLPEITELNCKSEKQMQAYSMNHYTFSALLPDENAPIDYGVSFSAPEETILRPEDTAPKKYMKTLLKIESYKIENHTGKKIIQKLKSMGHHPGALIGFYLLTATEPADGKRYDYYEAFVELK